MRAHNIRIVTAALLASLGLNRTALADESRMSQHLAAYYQTWSAESGPITTLDETLANLPAGLTEVLLAFMRPDAGYTGHLELTGTGLEVPYSGQVLKASLARLKARLPGLKVLVSIGGEQYANWNELNTDAIKRFVQDFELDGVDLDFEPLSPKCQNRMEHVQCGREATLLQIVKAMRAALPRPAALWLTATHTGAYGEGEWRAAPPTGSPSYGALVPFLRDRSNSAPLDLLTIMAYDAGPSFRPLEAFAAYRSYFSGSILIGFTSPPEAWGGHVYSLAGIVETMKAAVKLGAAGAMVFAIGKPPPSRPSAAMPRAEDMITALIKTVRSGQTDQPDSHARRSCKTCPSGEGSMQTCGGLFLPG